MFKNKKFISMLMAIVMLLAMVPANVFAAGSATANPTEVTIPASGSATTSITLTDDETTGAIDTASIAWTLATPATGVTVSGDGTATGKLDVSSTATAGTVTVNVSYKFTPNGGVAEDRTATVDVTIKAAPVPTTYTVKVNGGTASLTSAAEGATVTLTAGTAPAGQVFDKWNVVSGGVTLADATKPSTSFTMGTANVEVTATYKAAPTPTTYKVTFYENGGTTVATQTVVSGNKATAPTISRAGYTFDGWYLANGTKYDFNTPVTSNLVLTARWTAIVSAESVKITDANVYYNRVTGYATPYSTVQLYKDGYVVNGAYDVADANGYFEIYNSFGYLNNYYYNGYELYPSAGHYGLSGYTTANTYVSAYDGNGNFLGSDYSDSDGYYSISYSYVSNTSAIRVFKGYYDGYYNGYYNGYYDLNDYKLVATKNGVSSASYYLKYADVIDNGYYYKPVYDYARSAIVSSADAGSSFVKGYNVNDYATVTVKDSNGYVLGSSQANYNGHFTVYTNRALRNGETITVVSAIGNYRNASVNYVVGKVLSGNEQTIFTLDSTKYVKRSNGIDKTLYMDVAPYAKSQRTMLPIRYVAESLGYTVTYNNAMHMATFTNGKNVVMVDVFSDVFYINGVKHTFDVKPEIKSQRTMLPIAEVAKALGLSHGTKGQGKNIEWDAITNQVIVSVK